MQAPYNPYPTPLDLPLSQPNATTTGILPVDPDTADTEYQTPNLWKTVNKRAAGGRYNEGGFPSAYDATQWDDAELSAEEKQEHLSEQRQSRMNEILMFSLEDTRFWKRLMFCILGAVAFMVFRNWPGVRDWAGWR